MTFRKATIKDLPQIWDVFEASIKQSCINDYSEKQIAAWVDSRNNSAKWEKKVIEQFFYVAVVDNSIVGFISFQAPDYIDVMYVHPDHQKMGIATKLFTLILRHVMLLGTAELRVLSSITAKTVYEHFGFNCIQERVVELRGVEMPHYLMIKKMLN